MAKQTTPCHDVLQVSRNAISMATARRSTSWCSSALLQSSNVAEPSARLDRCSNVRGNSRRIALIMMPSSSSRTLGLVYQPKR